MLAPPIPNRAMVPYGRLVVSAEGSPLDQRRRPEETVLWQTVQAHWRSFVAEIESASEPLPVSASPSGTDAA
jgi:hypothetical protein